MTPQDSRDAAEGPDRRLVLVVAGLALVLVAAVIVVFGPRWFGREEGAPLASIPTFRGTAESGIGLLGEDPVGLPEAGTLAPDFALADLEGEIVHLSDYRDRPVLLNFWATWCAPCRLEMPELEKAQADYTDIGLVVLTINQEETAEQVRAFYDEVGLTMTALLDTEGEVGAAYGAYFLPSSVFVGPDGVVLAYHRGILSRDQIDAYLSDLASAGRS
jgi:peroxiredoxin